MFELEKSGPFITDAAGMRHAVCLSLMLLFSHLRALVLPTGSAAPRRMCDLEPEEPGF